MAIGDPTLDLIAINDMSGQWQNFNLVFEAYIAVFAMFLNLSCKFAIILK